MSSFNRIVITEPTTGPDAPAPSTDPIEGSVSPQNPSDQPAPSVPEGEGNQPESGDRPEWLPERFKSAEDLAKAYSELEKKFSQPKQAEAPKDPVKKEGKPDELVEPVKEETDPNAPKPPADESKVDLTPFHQEWDEKGELSPDSFEKLEKMGFPRSLVDQYIKGFQASQAQEAQAIFSDVGGEQNYRSMTEWAAKSLPPEEVKAYDEIVSRGDVHAARIAAKGLYAQFVAANGQPPKKLVGGKASGESTLAPFRSSQEVVKAMSDSRYKNDPAYRRDVEKRLEMSSVF
jgi:hypothetical protein